jgi:hypothetical protein
MQSTQKPLDHTFGNELQPAQLGDLHRIEQVEPRTTGWHVGCVHARRNVSARHW